MNVSDTLRPLALEIIYDHFADCDYDLGDKVISDVMIIWISQLVQCPHDYIPELDKVILSTQAQGQAQTWDALGKWASQFCEYSRQVSDEPVDRFRPPVFTLADSRAQSKVNLMRGAILDLLKSLGKDNGLRFMAILIVEWARRLNRDDFSNNSEPRIRRLARVVGYSGDRFVFYGRRVSSLVKEVDQSLKSPSPKPTPLAGLCVLQHSHVSARASVSL